MRSVPEWIGKSDNEAIPARVKVRIFDKANGKCACCGVPIIGKIRPAYDHIIAICNGGSNRESNLQLLCVQCHKGKSKADVAEKSKNYRVRAKHLGLLPKRQKIASRGFQKSAPQRTATRPIEKRRQP